MPVPPRLGFSVLVLAAALAVAWLLAPRQAVPLASYLPLHTALEAASIMVAALIFGVVWNAYAPERSGNVVILGAAFLGVGAIDFAHTLSYAGMPAFVTPSGPEKAIFFWLAARLVAATALLVVALRDERPLASPAARHVLLGAVLALTVSVYVTGLFHGERLPRTFIEGEGLTPFKVGAEYAVMALFAAAAAGFLRAARRGSQPARLLFMAAAISVLSELCFTLYSQVSDAFNLIGHLYKAAAYFFIYRAVFVASVREPIEMLAERESRLVRTERLAHVGSWELEAASGRLHCSDEALRILGVSRNEFPGTLAAAVNAAHPEDRERFAAAIDAALAGRTALSLDYRVVRPDGRVRHLHCEDDIVRGAPGVPVRLRGYIQDITERKLAELALQERDAGLEQAQRIAQLAHVVTGEHGEFASWSSTLPQLAGVASAALPRSTREWLKLVHPEDRALFRAACIDAGAQQQSSGIEYRLQRPNGRVVHIRQTMLPLPLDAEGEVRAPRWFSTLQDVTELRRAGEQVATMARRLVALQEEERRSLSRELHDRLGQKLSALSLQLGRLRGRGAAEQVDECLKLVEECGLDVHDLLGELKPPLLAERGLLPALRLHAQEVSRRKGLPTEVRGHCPRLQLDPEVALALFRIAQAALDNAAKHAHARHAEIVVAREGGRLVLEVCDDGRGFDPAAAAAAGRWGLTAMRERAEAIGAELRIDTAPAGGTRIRVELES